MDIDEEFNDPNTNFLILMKELEQRIKTLQNDLQVIQDPELRGFANKLYRKLKVEYFYLLKSDLELAKMFESENISKEEDEFIPFEG